VFAVPSSAYYMPGAPFLMAALAYLLAVGAVWTVRTDTRR